MTAVPRVRIVVLVAVAVLVAALCTVTAVGSPAAARVAPALRVSPMPFLGGQRLVFAGTVGVPGRRTVSLQRHMGRAGDRWTNTGRRVRTAADGRFWFTFPGLTMKGTKVRVVSGRLATPPVLLQPRAQEVVVTADPTPVAGQPFDVRADTAPVVAGRFDLPGPALAGRALSLQERHLGTWVTRGYARPWRTVATTTTDARGQGRFTVTRDEPGAVVYRVRMEDWTRGGDRVGWFPSFPLAVDVLSSRRAAARAPAGVARRAPGTGSPEADARPAPVARVNTDVEGTNNHSPFGWGRALWDFGWPYGESLDSRPERGTRSRGRWIDWSTGTGRAAIHNGALEIDSKPRRARGPGDIGTTGVMLRGNPTAYGRWDLRLRLKPYEAAAKDYRMLVELVPERTKDYRCGGATITIADLRANGKVVRFGSRSLVARRQWTGRRAGVDLHTRSHYYGVEVARDHVTWFLDGRPMGTVRHRRAAPGVPLTVRMRMVGSGEAEMNRTEAMVDWVRAYGLRAGRQVRWARGLRGSAYRGGC